MELELQFESQGWPPMSRTGKWTPVPSRAAAAAAAECRLAMQHEQFVRRTIIRTLDRILPRGKAVRGALTYPLAAADRRLGLSEFVLAFLACESAV